MNLEEVGPTAAFRRSRATRVLSVTSSPAPGTPTARRARHYPRPLRLRTNARRRRTRRRGFARTCLTRPVCLCRCACEQLSSRFSGGDLQILLAATPLPCSNTWIFSSVRPPVRTLDLTLCSACPQRPESERPPVLPLVCEQCAVLNQCRRAKVAASAVHVASGPPLSTVIPGR